MGFVFSFLYLFFFKFKKKKIKKHSDPFSPGPTPGPVSPGPIIGPVCAGPSSSSSVPARFPILSVTLPPPDPSVPVKPGLSHIQPWSRLFRSQPRSHLSRFFGPVFYYFAPGPLFSGPIPQTYLSQSNFPVQSVPVSFSGPVCPISITLSFLYIPTILRFLHFWRFWSLCSFVLLLAFVFLLFAF